MFQLMKTFAKGYENHMIRAGRAQARRVLMTQSARSLEDMGISRHLLAQGVDAWPWRDGEEQPLPTRITTASKRREEKRAIRELRAMSTAELSDMGITRGGIVAAVRYGRRDDTYQVPASLKASLADANTGDVHADSDTKEPAAAAA